MCSWLNGPTEWRDPRFRKHGYGVGRCLDSGNLNVMYADDGHKLRAIPSMSGSPFRCTVPGGELQGPYHARPSPEQFSTTQRSP